jgi:hypothetical protein
VGWESSTYLNKADHRLNLLYLKVGTSVYGIFSIKISESRAYQETICLPVSFEGGAIEEVAR